MPGMFFPPDPTAGLKLDPRIASQIPDNVGKPEPYKKGVSPLDNGAAYNVHGEYPWTLNDSNGLRKYVPKVILKEYKLTNSGELNALRNSIAASQESASGQIVRALAASRIGASTGRALAPAVGGNARRGAIYGGVAAAAFSLIASQEQQVITNIDPLKPYEGLYPAVETKNLYYLPYLNVDNMTDSSGSVGSWKAPDETFAANLKKAGKAGASMLVGEAATAFTQLVGAFNEAAQNAQQLEFAMFEPGAATEKIKLFAPKEEGDVINIVFYLSNTIGVYAGTGVHPIQRNWDFLYKLTFQNLPNRRSINLLDPPCVYDVEVPGFKKFPIAVIDSLKITNEGTTRMVNITNGQIEEANSGSGQVKLVPEAYKVSISIRSLLMNTQNLFAYSSSVKDQYNQINVFAGGKK